MRTRSLRRYGPGVAHGRAGGSFVFHLEPDENDDLVEEVPREPSRLERAAGAARARVRAWPRRRVVAVATVLGVGLAGTVGALTVTAAARQRAWAQVATTTPGAVLDLGHAPVEAWRVPIAGPMPIGLVDDVLVVQSNQGDADEGPSLYGVDLEEGEIVWTAAAPGASGCSVGATTAYTLTYAPRVDRGDVVVCLDEFNRRASVIDGDGTVVAQRELDDAPPEPSQDDVASGYYPWGAHRAYPTSDGGLLRFDRMGPAAKEPAAVVDDPVEVEPGAEGVQVYPNRTVTLQEPLVLPPYRARLEDAATGEVRWETVLEADELPAGSQISEGSGCMWIDFDGPVFSLDGWANDVLSRTTVWTGMCGIDAVLDLATGEVLQRRDTSADGYLRQSLPTIPLADGLSADISHEELDGDGVPESMRIVRDDGTVVGDVPGFVTPLLATDGPGSALLLAVDPDGAGVSAYDVTDAHRVWRSTAVGQGQGVVRTTDVVVVTDGRTVAGLSHETGETLWTHELYESGQDSGASGWYPVVDALTDGRRVVVVVPTSVSDFFDPTVGEKRTVALDLASGRVAWTTVGTDPAPQPIEGRLYRFDTDAVVALE